MEGYEVTTVEEAVKTARIIVTTTGCRDIVRGEHMMNMVCVFYCDYIV